MRINRYIVGCKFIIVRYIRISRIRINRYIVGCKSHILTAKKLQAKRINRYIVGCKYKGERIYKWPVLELIDT